MDWLSTIIGAAIGFVSSVGIIVSERLIDRAGIVKVYARIVYQQTTNPTSWGFDDGQGEIYLKVPVWLELENLSNAPRVVRDVNLVLFNRTERVAEMVQINRRGTGEHAQIFGNNGGYSFVLEPRSIQRYECFYSLKQDLQKSEVFDRIKLRYYDEKDKEHLLLLGKVDGDWSVKEFPRSAKWIKLKKK